MKTNSVLLAIILVVTFLSCDQRMSKKERLEHAVNKFNKNQKSIDVITYYPESYTEIKTDSIISKTFKVSIRNYSSHTDEILLNQTVKDLKKISKYHRRFESEITISVADHVIYQNLISAQKFRDLNTSEFWQNATLEHVWINQDLSNERQLALEVSFINPISKAYKYYEMLVDKNGNERLTLIEDHS